MSRRADIVPKKHIHTTVDAALAARVELLLFSELEGRVPQGAWQEFITKLIQNYFDGQCKARTE